MGKNKRLLIIGLDGVSWNVLDPMIKNGHMPFLKEFIKDGTKGILKSTEPPITPTAWTSFQTGLRPEIHGVWGFRNFNFVNGHLEYELNSSSSILSGNIWQLLSKHNKKLCVINLPLTYPPFEINGIMVSGFPTPSGSDCEYTYPRNFKEDLLREIPDYQVINFENWANINNDSIENFIEAMINISSQRAHLSSYLLNRDLWDIFMVHFQETDFIQHKYWHYLDRIHPNYSEVGFKKCARYYNYLDKALRDIVSIAREKGYSTVFMSDHGFQRSEYQFRINDWLFIKKYLHITKGLKHRAVSELKKIIKLLPLNSRLRFSNENMKFNYNNHFLEKIIDYNKSSIYVEVNSTNVARAHFIKNDANIKNQFLSDIFKLKTPEGRKVVAEISPTKDDNIFNILFENGIVAIGMIVNREPLFSKPMAGKSAQIGVHHKDGLIIIEGTLEEKKLPKEIHQVFGFFLNLYGINHLLEEPYSNMPIQSLNDNERKHIWQSLQNLGYL
jgi:predicted AlkP superfamily phosphohydrolase/phosphomutase